MVIRNLTEKELPQWLEFLKTEIFRDDPEDVVEGIWYDDPYRDISGVFVAVDGDEVIGSVKASCRDIDLEGQTVYGAIISGVGVKDEYRQKGIAGQLLEVCHDYLADKGAVVAHLYSKADTLELYKHLGYFELPQAEGEDFYRMYRYIAEGMK